MECVLKDLIAVSKDGEWGKGEPFDDSVEMFAIRGTDFEEVRFGVTAGTPRRHIAKRHAERKLLQPWDLIIEAAGGTKNQITGRTVVLRPQLFSRSELPFTCASFSRFIRFRTELCDPEFMFWYLQNLYASGLMHAYHTQHTGVARFQWTTFSEREPLEIPPLPVQRRIAGILSTYDELMENSQRRIRILEAMARALYREWFVHFRFPGHEKLPRASSPLGDIPKGWAICALGDFVQFKSGFAFKSGTFTADGELRLVTIKNVQDGAFNPESDSRMSELPERLPEYCILNDGDILLSLTGNVGRVCLVYDGPFLLNQRVSKLAPIETFDWALTYCMFREPEMRTKLEQLSNGVAQQNLSPVLASKMDFALPPRAVRERFAAFAEPMVRRIVQLYSIIQNLRRTRDLLLPRLLSGQVELDIVT